MDEYIELCRYSARGDLQMVKKLIKEGVNINTDDSLPLKLACESGYLDIVKYLIEKGVDPDNYKYIDIATEFGHLEVVKYLVKLNTSIHSGMNECLVASASGGHLEIVKYFLDFHSDKNLSLEEPLLEAIKYDRLPIVKYLIKQGANIHDCNDYGLLVASNLRHLEMVKYLVGLGCNVNLIKDPNLCKQMKEYQQLKSVMGECLKRIHFDPSLERTKTEQMDFYNKLKKDQDMYT